MSGERGDEGGTGRRGRPRWAVTAAAAAAVTVIAVGLYGAAESTAPDSGDPADGAPARLVLDGYGPEADAVAGAAEPGRADGYGGAATLRAEGPLPEGPGRAPVYRFEGTVGEAEAAALARTFGIEGPVREAAGAWTVQDPGDGALSLTVQQEAPGYWSFSRAGPALPGDLGPDAPVDSGPAPSPDGEAPPTEEQAMRVAAPVLAAAGQGGADLTVHVDASATSGGLRTVTARPEVGGLAVHGWETTVTVGPDGSAAGGTGALAAPVEGDVYRVLGAEETLRLLNAHTAAREVPAGPLCPPDLAEPVPYGTKEPAPEMPPVDGGPGGGTDGVPCGPEPVRADPVPVTGAQFGLAPHYSEGEPVLVPAWLFTAHPEGAAPYTVGHPAVDPLQLSSGTGAGATPDSGTDVGEPGGGSDVEPGDPGEEPASGMSVEPHGPGARALTVHFWGGVCAETAVTAEETSDAVTLRLVTLPGEGGEEEACILVAERQTATVRLDGPVGDRDLLDERGRPVPAR
ncbi:membrane protein [Streptomyces sodiiphilus]|uniref:Membrane protein n=1 Tax=Streptomyces sodiiphilus TaxID=226217 RepID=A0ABN2PWR8_9ACTN